jgi:translation initiation factor IF-2
MPCSRARLTPPFGVDPHRDRHAAALLDPTAGSGPSWRCQATRPAMPGCSSWLMSRPQAGGSGPRKGRAALGPGCPGCWSTGASGWTVIDRPQRPTAATGPRATPWPPSGPAASPGPRPPHQPPPARAPRSAKGAAYHPGRHRRRWGGRSPSAQGPDRHRPRAAARPPAGAPLGASRSAPGWWPCLVIRWSTGPPRGHLA